MIKFYIQAFFIIFVLSGNSGYVFTQPTANGTLLYFLSDCQEPMKTERLFLEYTRNIEARDSLFKDIIRLKPDYLFLLGDLISVGSDFKSWRPVDTLLFSLQKLKTKVYATPGNHEYYFKARQGVRNFNQRFSQKYLSGYYVIIDSLAVVMLNSNFYYLSEVEINQQQLWYISALDKLDTDKGIKAIVVCTHHSPYSNSKTVGSSKPVGQYFIPQFKKSLKTKLFITGHSHNLEYFKDDANKHYLVIGGGGGLTQPLLPFADRQYLDLLDQDKKPVFFYLILKKNGNRITLIARGLNANFARISEFEVGVI